MRAPLAFLALLLLSGQALASAFVPALSGVDASCQGYETIDAAAAAGLALASGSGQEDHEYAGVVYRRLDGSYCYSVPVSNGSDENFRIQVQLPKGSKLAGLYHTHPIFPESDQFSESDINVAKAMHLPSFIKIIATGEIKLFDPTGVRLASMRQLRKPRCRLSLEGAVYVRLCVE